MKRCKNIFKILFVILILATPINIFSVDESYSRVKLPYVYGPFSSDLIIDLRYINYLERSGNLEKLGKAYSMLLENCNNPELLKFYKYLIAERNYLRNSTFDWVYSSPDTLYNKLKEMLMEFDKEEILKILPPSISVAFYQSDISYEYSKMEFIKKINIAISNKTNVSDLIKITDDIFLLYANNIKFENQNVSMIFLLNKIKDSIFKKMNEKFEITTVLIVRDENALQFFLKNKSSYFSFEKKYIYGIIDFNYSFKINQYYKTTVDKLRLRISPSINADIICNLNKNEIVTLMEVGDYDAISDLGGNWVKVKTKDNQIGWCFSAYLVEHIDVPIELK